MCLLQRQIAVTDLKTTKSPDPDLANRIIQSAANRTGKTKNSTNTVNDIPTHDDIEKNKQDIASLNSDIQLLSSLLGRPVPDINLKDLAKGTESQRTTSQRTSSTSYGTTTVTTARTTRTTTKSPTTNTALIREVELLQTILQKPSSTAPDLIDPAEGETYGKTNDALLATLLKQRGIGPVHNNIPTNLYTTTTTRRPRAQFPVQSSRPILDGLAWLWRMWQDTAPGAPQQTPTNTVHSQRDVNSQKEDLKNSSPDSMDDGVDSDVPPVNK